MVTSRRSTSHWPPVVRPVPWFVTESVDSTDGELAPLWRCSRVRARGRLLVVDEAHGLGVCGREAAACSAVALAGRATS